MTPLDSFHPRTEWLRWSRSTRAESPGVVPSHDRRTPLESFYPRTEGLPWSRSIPGQNDYSVVVRSEDRMTPLDFFCPEMKKKTNRVVPYQDRRTVQKSFHPKTELLLWSCSIPGQNDSLGVVPFQDRRTPQESFHPRTE